MTTAPTEVAGGEGLIGSWSPGFGDPTPVGWVTTIAYFAAFCTCAAVSLRLRRASRGPSAERWLWPLLALLCVGLGLNKQLDLQSAVMQIGRALAHAGGWYERRRSVQREFVAFIGIIAAIAAAALARLGWRASHHTRLGVAGALLLLVFVVLRAASFNHLGRLLGGWVAAFGDAAPLELAGILMVIVASVARLTA